MTLRSTIRAEYISPGSSCVLGT